MSGNEWKSIESAPKDGSPILLFLEKEPNRHYPMAGRCPRYAIGLWEYGCWKSIETEDCGYMGGEYTGWCEDWVGLDLRPSHWMPLPEPPLPASGAGKEEIGK